MVECGKPSTRGSSTIEFVLGITDNNRLLESCGRGWVDWQPILREHQLTQRGVKV